MEPISSAAIAIATLILNKASEKTGEKLGEAVSHQVGKLAQLVKGKASKTAAIEQTEQTVDYGQAVLELESAIEKDPELSQTVQELAAAVQSDSTLAEKVTAYAEALKKSQPSTVQNYTKLADKIGIVQQGGGSVSIENFNL
jgi:predicted O-linked N-acetylglucosamine transferase (SPINDLY family)